MSNFTFLNHLVTRKEVYNYVPNPLNTIKAEKCWSVLQQEMGPKGGPMTLGGNSLMIQSQ